MQDFEHGWKADKRKDLQWADNGLVHAKALYENKQFEDAIRVCEFILSIHPIYHKALNRYGWSLYQEFIKSSKNQGDEKPRHEVATNITNMFRRMEPYTPYANTCLTMADSSMRKGEYGEAKYWLSKIDENGLSQEELKNVFNGQLTYWSQRRKYLSLLANYHFSIGSFDEGITTTTRVIRECPNSAFQIEALIRNVHDWFIRQYDQENLVEKLLTMRGFTNNEVRITYIRMLERRFSYENLYPKMDRFDIDEIVFQLLKEIVMPLVLSIKKVELKTQKISATSLSNFTFCPASYSLQETYQFGSSELANTGTMMHNKQLLLSRKMEETKKGFHLYATQKNSSYLDSASIDDKVRLSISPLIRDISSSNLVFTGHNRDEPKLFYDDSGTIVGSPDYIFEKTNGTRYVVEEKFSFQKKNAKPISEPYKNHLVQLATYTTALKEIGATYGYLLYWSYSLGQFNQPYVTRAQVFRIENSIALGAEIASLVKSIKRLNQTGSTEFNTSELNPWKCVNCVTTDHCVHKTGTKRSLTLPYT